MICKNCHAKFSEPKTIRTTREDYYGVDSTYKKPMSLEVCPYCKAEEIEEEEEEWN